jgi:hypothetical protein
VARMRCAVTAAAFGCAELDRLGAGLVPGLQRAHPNEATLAALPASQPPDPDNHSRRFGEPEAKPRAPALAGELLPAYPKTAAPRVASWRRRRPAARPRRRPCQGPRFRLASLPPWALTPVTLNASLPRAAGSIAIAAEPGPPRAASEVTVPPPRSRNAGPFNDLIVVAFTPAPSKRRRFDVVMEAKRVPRPSSRATNRTGLPGWAHSERPPWRLTVLPAPPRRFPGGPSGVFGARSPPIQRDCRREVTKRGG